MAATSITGPDEFVASVTGVAPPLAILETRAADAVVITLVGDLTEPFHKQFAKTVETAIDGAGLASIRIDVCQVTVIDTDGLRSLILARQLAQRRAVTFTLGLPYNGPVVRRLISFGLKNWFAESARDDITTRLARR